MSEKTVLTPEEKLALKLAQRKEYSQRPEVKQRRREYQQSPEAKQRAKEYYQRPEVQQRYKDREKSEAHQEYQRQWRSRPESKKLVAESNRRRFHFPTGTYDKLLVLQNHACAVCLSPFDLDKSRHIHSDHCHEGKAPRGLLCRNCNMAEGFIKRLGISPEEFGRRLTSYLANPPANLLAGEKP